MRTDDLRKLCKTQLDTLKIKGVKEVYYKTAANDAGFPHIVFNMEEIGTQTDNIHRFDYRLLIDVWDKGKSESVLFDICDSIEELLSAKNLPQTNILPSFFYDNRRSVEDEDKNIKHQLIQFDVQLYEK